METTWFLNCTVVSICNRFDIPAFLKNVLGYAYPEWNKKAA